MPPFLPRKRLRSLSAEAESSKPPAKRTPKRTGKAKASSMTPRKPTLFDDLDAGTGPKRNVENGKALLEKLVASSDESSLSSLSDDQFEDVPNAKRQKMNDDVDEEDSDEDMEFEDVTTYAALGPSIPTPSGDLELTLTKNPRINLTNPYGTKKGPSKIERLVRVATHQAHVMFLMWNNALRNGWLCDKELQEILVKQLPPTIEQQVEKWRRDSGLLSRPDQSLKEKGKGKAQNTKGKKTGPRSQRDWGEPAQRLAEGQVNMSGGDPLLRLLKVLENYWRQRFRITAPGLRKLGYMSLERLDQEVKSFKNNEYDPEQHGERFRDIKEFREAALNMEGSRDVGAQLFTALIRGLGLEARMVASLQPSGFGWTHNEEALEKNPRKLKAKKSIPKDGSSDDERTSTEDDEFGSPAPSEKKKGKAPAKPKRPAKKSARRNFRRESLEDDSSHASVPEDSVPESEAESVVDVTPLKKHKLPSLPYDRDLLYPHYWTEVLSPVTNTYTPVDPIVLHIVATSRELVEKFESRGGKSEKAKQVTAYIIGHASDGTAKDVTTRYLKGKIWPGRTKGNRFPVEKVAIRDRNGKVKYYQERDWFKKVMSGYARGSKECPRTEIDDQEEATDLKPVKREKKEVEEGKETLQYYKTSPDFVLERHLKREEALIPTAQHVRMFAVKGKGEISTEEKVFSRKDVVNCKSMETWHKEGRAPKVGEEPLKRVPYRAATTNRRRELAEAEQASGEKVLQGLYSWDQTDWIIPDPIENGIIPKNGFGNIDLYVDSMLPQGAVHIPFRGTVKICKRLHIDYAEAVTGFEFGHRMAVPIISGVVVAAEHYDAVMEEFQKDETERMRKEDDKRRIAAIAMWRKMLMGMRIVEKLQEEYGDVNEDEIDLNPFTKSKKEPADDIDGDTKAQKQIMDQRDEEMAGGFLPEGFDVEEIEEKRSPSFFPVLSKGDEDDDEGGGFIVEGNDNDPIEAVAKGAYATPQSLEPSMKPKAKKIFDSDTDVDDIKFEADGPTPKKRGRLSGSSAKTSQEKSDTKTKPQIKKREPQKTTTSASRGRGRPKKLTVEDSEEEISSASASEEEEEEQEIAPKKAVPKRKAGRRTTLPMKEPAKSTRTVPKRKAARKSETALRSHYFQHSDDGDNE